MVGYRKVGPRAWVNGAGGTIIFPAGDSGIMPLITGIHYGQVRLMRPDLLWSALEEEENRCACSRQSVTGSLAAGGS